MSQLNLGRINQLGMEVTACDIIKEGRFDFTYLLLVNKSSTHQLLAVVQFTSAN